MYLMLMALALQGSTVSAAPASPPISATPIKEKLICIDDTETGTLISKRVCHTKTQWKAIADQGQESVNTIRNAAQPGFCPPNHPGCMGG